MTCGAFGCFFCLLFAAAQAAQKFPEVHIRGDHTFAAAQAAQKSVLAQSATGSKFAAAQAAQKPECTAKLV